MASDFYLPSRVIKNEYFQSYLDTTEEWILRRTGIQERRWAMEGEQTSDMAVSAAERLFSKVDLSKQEIDLILVATMSPDYPTPATAALVQKKLGIKHAAGFDLSAACAGFVYGLSVAKSFIESQLYRNILLIGAEKMSALVDPQDRSIIPLFGDGAGAVLISGQERDSATSGYRIGRPYLGLRGDLVSLLYTPAGGSANPVSSRNLEEGSCYLQMEGREVFRMAILLVSDLIRTILQKEEISIEEIDYFLIHQANIRILNAIQETFGIPEEKVIKTISWTANTSAASLPILLAQGGFLSGKRILMVGFGAGFAYGGVLLTVL